MGRDLTFLIVIICHNKKNCGTGNNFTAKFYKNRPIIVCKVSVTYWLKLKNKMMFVFLQQMVGYTICQYLQVINYLIICCYLIALFLIH